ncbi:hypothetical protein [Burkholderia sp. NLJ2]|uniref:hypothetical protein n=1 Tax=Burkholderia sp. NLJ2 TaxID=3090699 RepID=UPI003C6C4866
MTRHGELLIEEIVKHRSCRALDDVRWSDVNARFEGSLFWHGVPTSTGALEAFASFAASRPNLPAPVSVVVGIASSGIAWATAVALRMALPLAVLRLTEHRYGPTNLDVRRHAGRNAYLIDNHFGSGETIGQARSLLANYSVNVAGTCVVEAREPDPGIVTPLTVDAKLRALLERGYFSRVGAEIAERYLLHKDDWLADTAWVRRVRDDLRRENREPGKGESP